VKIAIHQPEHFPYEGFFKKMKEADIFVILDTVKFKKNNFQNRNKILNSSGSEEWFGFPVSKKSNSIPINKVTACDESIQPWRKKLIKKIKQNLKFDVTRFYESDSLLSINMAGIEWIKNELKIATPIVLSSELNVGGVKSELLLNICKELSGTSYLSGIGGKEYLNQHIFSAAGVHVDFFKPEIKNYYSMLYNLSIGA
jgi:hypothetical protein